MNIEVAIMGRGITYRAIYFFSLLWRQKWVHGFAVILCALHHQLKKSKPKKKPKANNHETKAVKRKKGKKIQLPYLDKANFALIIVWLSSWLPILLKILLWRTLFAEWNTSCCYDDLVEDLRSGGFFFFCVCVDNCKWFESFVFFWVGFLELCGFLELLYVAAGEKKIWRRVGIVCEFWVRRNSGWIMSFSLFLLSLQVLEMMQQDPWPK